MNGFAMVGSILPLFAYFLITLRYGQKRGIWAALVTYLAFMIWDWLDSGQLDRLLLLEGALLVGLGGLALRLNDSRLFKFQPALMGMIFSLVLGWFQFFDIPLLVKMVPRMKQLMPTFAGAFEDPLMLERLASMSGHAAGLLMVHAVLMGYAAIRFRDRHWFLARLAIYPLMFGLAFIHSFILGYRSS